MHHIIASINSLLKSEYKSPRLSNPDDPLEDLVFLLLSPRIRSDQHLKIFAQLRALCPDFSKLLEIPCGELQDCVRKGGLSKQKIDRLEDCLKEIERRNGTLSLDTIREMNEADAELFLRSLPGVGIKIARCVMMYTLEHQVFPVDINVHRILTRVGIVDEMDSKRDKTHDIIQDTIPPEYRYDLHVNLVMHGKTVCQPRNPKCGGCALSFLCKYNIASSSEESYTGVLFNDR